MPVLESQLVLFHHSRLHCVRQPRQCGNFLRRLYSSHRNHMCRNQTNHTVPLKCYLLCMDFANFLHKLNFVHSHSVCRHFAKIYCNQAFVIQIAHSMADIQESQGMMSLVSNCMTRPTERKFGIVSGYMPTFCRFCMYR